MTHFRVRPVKFGEKAHTLPACAAIPLSCGIDVRNAYRLEWRELVPSGVSLARKARACVEYDRSCTEIAKARAACGME